MFRRNNFLVWSAEETWFLDTGIGWRGAGTLISKYTDIFVIVRSYEDKTSSWRIGGTEQSDHQTHVFSTRSSNRVQLEQTKLILDNYVRQITSWVNVNVQTVLIPSLVLKMMKTFVFGDKWGKRPNIYGIFLCKRINCVNLVRVHWDLNCILPR